MEPTCRPQVGPMLAPWTLLSRLQFDYMDMAFITVTPTGIKIGTVCRGPLKPCDNRDIWKNNKTYKQCSVHIRSKDFLLYWSGPVFPYSDHERIFSSDQEIGPIVDLCLGKSCKEYHPNYSHGVRVFCSGQTISYVWIRAWKRKCRFDEIVVNDCNGIC